MCDIRPGTRCAYDMRAKVQKRTKKLEEAEHKFGKQSPEYVLAAERLTLAEKQYDATREGIKNIEKLITETEYDEELIHRYKEAKLTNSVQTLSVKEIKNGRQALISSLSSEVFEKDEQETFSVLEAARTFQENRIFSSLNEEATSPVSAAQWGSYVESLREALKVSGKLTPETANKLKALSKTPPPPVYIYSCYSNYEKLNQLSDKHKQEQQQMIASVAGSDLKTVKEAHKKLRQKYLAMSDKPSIPEQWMRGEASTAGIMNSPRFRYAPSDPASAYANYTLMYNNDALPDYQKRAHNFVSVEQKENSVTLSKYSPTGKLLYVESYPKSTPNLLTQIKKETEGAVLVTEHPSRTGLLSLEEFASHHLDLPSYSKQNVKAAVKSSTDSTVELFLRTLASSKKVWNSKKERRELV